MNRKLTPAIVVALLLALLALPSCAKTAPGSGQEPPASAGPPASAPGLSFSRYIGTLAILTEDAELSSPYAITTGDGGEQVMRELGESFALSKNDMVVVIDKSGGICRVSAVAGDPPRIRGYIDESALSYDAALFAGGNQCILREATAYDGGGNEAETLTGLASVVQRADGKALVSPVGYGAEFWVDESDLSYDFDTEIMDAAPDFAGA